MMAPSLADWLKSHDLERFVQIFSEHEIDLTTLRLLAESDLKEIGLPFGPRKRILHLLAEENVLDKTARAASAPHHWLGEFATARRQGDQELAAHQAIEAEALRRGHPFGLASALAIGVKLFDSLDRGFERLVETGHRVWAWYLRICEMRGKF
jgi:hypothetical protein